MFSKSMHIRCYHFLLSVHCRLETLILTSNNIDSVACFTICAGVIENRGLKKVVLDGNPIGEQVRDFFYLGHTDFAKLFFCTRKRHIRIKTLFLQIMCYVSLFFILSCLGNESIDVGAYDCWKPSQGEYDWIISPFLCLLYQPDAPLHYLIIMFF